MKVKILAAKSLVFFSLLVGQPTGVSAGIPVIDAANLTQTLITAIESIAQTINLIDQYSTQLQQYENQLQNTLAPSAYIWDRATTTMANLRSSIDTLSYYRNQLGSVDRYLSRFQAVDYYQNLPCFNGTGCSEATWDSLRDSLELGSESQKRANDALFRGIDQQQEAIEDDASTLENLQNRAQTAVGQMQAIQYANQLASQQANQLLQIRGLMIAQQNAVVTKMQADADKDSLQRAASDQLRRGPYRASTLREW